MVPNPFFAKVVAKVITSLSKSALKAYSNTLRKNNAAQGKKAFKFDWNDIFKYHKLNILNYIDAEKFKRFNPFDRVQDKVMDSMSKNNTHKISQMEAVKILGLDPEQKLTLKMVMEQYLFLYSKNKPETGGSAYIQAKVLNAKDMLVEQLGGLTAEMQWREINGFVDDDNTTFDTKPDAKKTTEDAQKEDVLLESDTLVQQDKKNKSSEEEDLELQKKLEEEAKQAENDEESSSSDEETEEKKEEKKQDENEEKKEGEQTAQNELERKIENKKKLEGEFSKYSEENAESIELLEKEDQSQDHEIDQLINKMENDEENKSK